MANVTLDEEQYAALASLAKASTTDIEKSRTIDAFLATIEKANNIKRYFLWVQWQPANKPLPVGTRFPEKWPPELRAALTRYDRPWSKKDVLEEVNRRANQPISILVTRDPGGQVGWSPIDLFFPG